MKFAVALMLLCAVSASEETHWGIPEEEDVGVLTNDTFSGFVNKHSHVFVKFYAPWCGHCKSMVPAYSALAKRFKEAGVPVVKVDATVESDIASEYGIEGFPTLKLFVNGEPVDYSGERTEEAMYNFVSKKTGPASELLKGEDELKELEGQKVSVLLFTPEGEEDILKAFNAVGSKYDNITFRHSHDEALKKKYHGDKHVLIVHRNFDDGHKLLSHPEKLTQSDIADFVQSVRFPIVSDFDESSAERIFGSEAPAIFLFTDKKDGVEIEEFTKFAKEHSKRIIFSKSSISDELGARLSEFLGITAADDPSVRIIRFKNNNIDKFKVDEIKQEALAKALDAFEANTLSAYYKSQPVPETNEDPVKVIVGDNFNSDVVESDKFVLLEAYAPWCGHCQQLEPVYNKLAELVKSAEDVVIAKIDATANENSALNIEGFPTIYLFKPKHEGEPIAYDGDRSLSSLVEFLEKHVGRKLVNEKLPEDIEDTDASEETDASETSEAPETDEL